MSTIQATEGLSRIQDAQLTLRGTEAEYLTAHDTLAATRSELSAAEAEAWLIVPGDLKADGQRAFVAAEVADATAEVLKAQATVSLLEIRMRNVRSELYTLGAFYGAPHREG